MNRRLEQLLPVLGLFLVISLAGCQKPQLRTESAGDSEEDPFTEEPVAESPPPVTSPAGKEKTKGKPASSTFQPLPDPEPKRDPRELARAIAEQEDRLEAQLTGIRSLESDLARHTAVLTDLQNQLNSIRARQQSERSGGILVERIGGKSVRIDRKAEARQVQKKIDAEQQLVTQFTRSLESARQEYAALQQFLNQLRAQR